METQGNSSVKHFYQRINQIACVWCACVVLFAGAASSLSLHAAETEVVYPDVETGRTLAFPRDHGAHPEYRTEWWYVTGWVESRGVERGFQVTFFRVRTGLQETNKSQFAPKQLIFAHAAIADSEHGRLRHDQRVAREGFDLASASIGETGVEIDGWTLFRDGDGYRASIVASDFGLNLELAPTQPVLLQGRAGYSRKGPQAGQASYYYSIPQLRVSGSMQIGNESLPVQGEAWLDHEWSSEILPEEAQGWDWVGINLGDGGALMAFRMRARNGETLWAGGSVRDANGDVQILSPGEITFEPLRQWRSPRTGAVYPVAMRVRAGTRVIDLEPLMDDQELDSSFSTGIIYWEGAVRARVNGKSVGRGYLELTGYAGRPRM